MLFTIIKNGIVTNRLQQIADTFLSAIMEEHVLAQQGFNSVSLRQCQAGFNPAVFRRMKMTANSKIKITRKQGLQLLVMQAGILTTDIAAHRLNRKQTGHITIE